MKIFLAIVALILAAQPACRAPRLTPPGIQVVDDAQGRKLLIGGRLRAFVDTSTWESRLKYVAVMNLPMRFYSHPGSMLLIGLGGGSIARNYLREGWSVESAETDTALVRVARASFGLDRVQAKIRPADGREYLSSHADVADQYDVILEDLVSTRGDGHLMTAEHFGLVRGHLKPGGMFGIALECPGWQGEVVLAVASTLRERFPYVSVLPIAEPPNRFGSIVLIASASRLDSLARDVDRNTELSPEWRFGPGYQETHAWDNRFASEPDPRLVQTDTRNSYGRIFELIDDSARAQPAGYLP